MIINNTDGTITITSEQHDMSAEVGCKEPGSWFYTGHLGKVWIAGNRNANFSSKESAIDAGVRWISTMTLALNTMNKGR